MQSFFHTINEGNKLALNKPSDSDVVYYSELHEWFTSNAFRSFSLKYVVDRCIHYKVGRKEHSVRSGNFLLACKQPSVQAYFDSDEIVRSVCIDICPATVAEAFTVLTSQGDHNFDNYLAGYFKAPEFFEAVCPVQHTTLRPQLHGLINAIHTGEASEHVDREWFLELVEKVIFHEYGHYLALNGIKSLKLETRKEILQRLKIAKAYMDDELLNIESIAEIATVCNMSEFHFYRSFRQAFGLSPYQYLLNKRLALSRTLIAEGRMSVTDIATYCNFPDISTFSKAFKRSFGVAPTRFIVSAD